MKYLDLALFITAVYLLKLVVGWINQKSREFFKDKML